MPKLPLHLAGACLCLLFAINVTAQPAKPVPPAQDHCATERIMNNLYKRRPASMESARRLEAFTQKFIDQNKQKALLQNTSTLEYVIPVVFHINDPYNPYMVTLNQIHSAIDILNQDYNLLNADYPLIDSLFIGIAANLHITFRLADIDPNGNPTTGVTYHYNSFDGTSPDGTGSDVKSVSYWPGNKYLNIWIVSEVEQKGVYNNSGWTYLPDDWVAANGLDGIVYNWRYLGAPGVGSSENGYPYMKRVLTHECGHYLNLWHTFQNGCAAPGDYVDDTPPTQSNFGGCNLNANWCGSIANTENYMDYSTCAKMFTNGQKARMMAALYSDVAKRDSIWTQTNQATVFLPANVPRIVPYSNIFMESDSNNGSIATADTLWAVGGAHFAISSGQLTAGTQFSMQHVPPGLTPVIKVLNDTTAVLTFSGRAVQNAVTNNTDSVLLTFLNGAVSGGVSSLFSPRAQFSIHFIDPYKIVYSNIPDILVDSAQPWTPFNFGWDAGDATYGGWYNNGQLRFEAYQKAVVCNGNTLNIAPLPADTLIGAGSNWVYGGAYPNEHNIYTGTYNNWSGKTRFTGVQFTIDGKLHYGWIRMSVSADGSRYLIKDWAYNQAPNATIKAGDPGNPTLSWSGSKVRENKTNDGSITDTLEVSILGASFKRASGNFVNGVDYTAANLPAGLTLVLTALDQHTARIAFTGKAISNESSNNATLNLTMLPAAFAAPHNNIPPDSASQSIAISFRDKYHIQHVTVNDSVYTINQTNTWYYFLMDNNPDAAYGLWTDSGYLRFETYSKPMICNGATRNISLLAAGRIISDTSNFIAGGPFPLEHYLYTPSFTDWKAKTGFAGFNFITGGDTLYGWFRFKVSADGSAYSLEDYAYNTQPGGSIRTGQISGVVDSAADATAYCPARTDLNYNDITRVRFAGLDNSSGWDGYKDFTSLKAVVRPGQSYTLTVNLGIEYWPDIDVAVWIDWNGDKVLNDTTEKVYVKRAPGPYTGTITVPANAKPGATLMRVRMGYGRNVPPCGEDNYQGEVEDYTVFVSDSTGPTGLPAGSAAGPNRLTANNPFADAIHLNYSAAQAGPALVTLYSLQGSVIRQMSVNVIAGDNRIDLTGLPELQSGFYILDVRQGRQHTQVKLIR